MEEGMRKKRQTNTKLPLYKVIKKLFRNLEGLVKLAYTVSQKNVTPLQLAIILHTQFDCDNFWNMLPRK